MMTRLLIGVTFYVRLMPDVFFNFLKKIFLEAHVNEHGINASLSYTIPALWSIQNAAPSVL